MPPTSGDVCSPSTHQLLAANQSIIPTYGATELKLDPGGCFTHIWQFIVADVKHPILGSDFLRITGLIIDHRGRKLIDSTSLVSVPLQTPRSRNVVSILSRASNEFEVLLLQFPAVLTPRFDCEVKHNVTHHIVTKGPPKYAKARRLAPDVFREVQEEFRSLERLGILRKSCSPWSSPLHVVPKADGAKKPCGDFRQVNDATEPDQYPLPHLHDFARNLHGCGIFSKVDLVKGYHQIPVAPADIPKSAIITPFGLWEYTRMPFGLRNSAQTFQRLMDSVLSGLLFVLGYLDDVLIASKTKKEHLERLKILLGRLSDHGLVVNAEKCKFGVSIFTDHKPRSAYRRKAHRYRRGSKDNSHTQGLASGVQRHR